MASKKKKYKRITNVNILSNVRLSFPEVDSYSILIVCAIVMLIVIAISRAISVFS